MTPNQITVAVARALQQAGIPYMLVGSFSSNLYGMPRSTKDADFVVQLGDRSISLILPFLTGDFVLDPQMRFESVTGTYRFVMTHHESKFTIEFFMLTDEPHDRSRFERRRVGVLEGQTISVPAVEDVVIQKLHWAGRGKRVKDREDALHVLQATGPDQLDLPYIRHWCDQHGTRELFEQLLKEAEPPVA